MKLRLQHFAFVFASMLLALRALAEPGDLDFTFNGTGMVIADSGSGEQDSGQAVAIQGDGKIVVAGTSSVDTGGGPFSSILAFSVARFRADGSLDSSFNGTGFAITPIRSDTDIANAVAVQQTDGAIVVAGESWNGTDYDIAVVRYLPNGTLDPAFNGTGKVIIAIGSGNDFGRAVAIQDDRKIVVAGTSWNGSDNDFALVRLMENGSLDTDFNGTGKVVTAVGSGDDSGLGVAIQDDQMIVVAGWTGAGDDGSNFAIARYRTNGTLDPNFNGSGVATTSFGTGFAIGRSVAIQGDGRIVVAGQAKNRFALARYSATGVLDTTFQRTGTLTTDVGAGEDGANSVAVQPDGRIVTAGSSATSDKIAVVRYLADGALDTSFRGSGKAVTPIGATAFARGVALQSDGKIVAAGTTFDRNGDNDFAVVRYQAVVGEVAGNLRFSAPIFVANESSRSALITVERLQSARTTIVASSETADGTAIAGQDYFAANGTLTFGPGQRKKSFRVELSPDQIPDGGETIALRLKSADGLTLVDAAMLVLREKSLALSPRKFSPGQVLTVKGAFDPAQPLYVRFSDFAANDSAILASDVTTRSATVRVPCFLDRSTLTLGAAKLAIQTEQGTHVIGPVNNVPVAAPSATGETAGAFALEFLKVTQETLALAETHWQAIENQSGGAFDTSELRAALGDMQTQMHAMEQELRDVIDGVTTSIPLGTLASETFALDAGSLAILDRMLVAAVFDGKFRPAAAGLTRLRGIAAPAAPVEPDPIGDFHDEFNPTLRETIRDSFNLTDKAAKIANGAAGKAFEFAEKVGVPGDALTPIKETFSAALYYTTSFGPSVMGLCAVSFAEPFIELELGRSVTIDDYQPALEKLNKESLAFLEEHKGRLLDKLDQIDSGGTVSTFAKRFDQLTEKVQKANDFEDETSVISKAFEAANTIYQNRPRPVVSFDDVSVTEPTTGSRNAAFLVSLDRVFDQPVTVSFATAPGSAGAGDFTPRNGTITIPKGSRGTFVTVAVRADSVNEDAETFSVNLTGVTNATLGKATGTGTILDARRSWSISGSFSANGNNYPFAENFALPRKGGVKTFSLGTGTARVTISATTVTVSGSGFGAEQGVTVSGSGGGSGSIVEGATSVSAAGAITGTLHVRYDDGSTDDFPITGNFTATGTK